MKLWQKSEQASGSERMDAFTVGKDRQFDIQLAEYDATGSLAHVRMLLQVGLLSQEDADRIIPALEEIRNEIREGRFILGAESEDIHSRIEELLVQRIGEAGKRIHSGRSRNDQVAVDIKLFLKARIREIATETRSLFDLLTRLSEQHREDLLPGHTHLQLAMPSSFGLWFGAYAEALVDDLEMMLGAFRMIDKNPLGSGAGYGSNFPLDRSMTTELLGFRTMNWNSINAQMARGKGERAAASAMSFIASTLSRFSMDVCLFMNEHFGFIGFPEELTTGSSLMPHKRNPDVFELIRGKCNRIQALPNELSLLCTNLPSGYHREMQLTKEILFPAIEELISCLQMTAYMLNHIQVRKEILRDEKYRYLFTVDALNNLVLQGAPFRDAYRQIGLEVAEGRFKMDPSGISIPSQPHEGSMHRLCTDEIRSEMEKLLKEFDASPR